MLPLMALIGAVATVPIVAAPPLPAAPAVGDDGDSTAVGLREVDTRMTVQVMLNGAGPFRFIVDSGATRSVISSRLGLLLGLPSAGMVTMHSVGGSSEVPTVRIDRLGLGGLPARSMIAPMLDEDDIGAAGILGVDSLENRKVVIDLVAHRMTIMPSDRHVAEAAPGEIVVVARRKYGQLVLADADAAGQRIWAIVDTGAMVSIGNGRLRDRLVRRRRAVPQSTVITDVAGRRIEASFAPIRDMRLSAWHVHGLSIAFSDAHAFERFGLADKPSMLLGMDLMAVFSRVSIDFSRRTVRLLRRDDASG